MHAAWGPSADYPSVVAATQECIATPAFCTLAFQRPQHQPVPVGRSGRPRDRHYTFAFRSVSSRVGCRPPDAGYVSGVRVPRLLVLAPFEGLLDDVAKISRQLPLEASRLLIRHLAGFGSEGEVGEGTHAG